MQLRHSNRRKVFAFTFFKYKNVDFFKFSLSKALFFGVILPVSCLLQVPDYENIILEPSRPRYTFQRSVSEPKPISSKAAAIQQQQHSQQLLHRFASFSRTFDFDKCPDPWTSDIEKELKDDKSAPIAKLESLDELDLVCGDGEFIGELVVKGFVLQESPQGSPKKPKK